MSSTAPLFDSTVAITMYNILCMSGPASSLEELYHRAQNRMHPTLKKDQATRALNELVRRGLLKQVVGGYALKDPKRRLVVDRITSGDEAFKGVLQGGWAGWKVRDPAGLLPIDNVIGDPK